MVAITREPSGQLAPGGPGEPVERALHMRRFDQADLTAMTAANGGQFPFWRIIDITAGEAAVPGHDTHQVPEFFARLKAQDFKPGYLPAHARVLELTHYLESIQKK